MISYQTTMFKTLIVKMQIWLEFPFKRCKQHCGRNMISQRIPQKTLLSDSFRTYAKSAIFMTFYIERNKHKPTSLFSENIPVSHCCCGSFRSIEPNKWSIFKYRFMTCWTIYSHHQSVKVVTIHWEICCCHHLRRRTYFLSASDNS